MAPAALNLRALRDRLVGAEMRFAFFNARRTCTGTGDGIEHRTHAAFEAVLDSSRPASTYYNRAAVRPGAALDADTLAALPAAIAAIETTPGHLDAAASARLIARGFMPAHSLCYLACTPAGSVDVPRNVQQLDAAATDLLFDLLQLEGVAFDAQKRAAKRGYYCTPQFRAFIVRDDQDHIGGWTTMFVEGATAFFGNSFTLPAYRRRGLHATLLAARLAAAARLGVEVAYTDVEFGSQSHDNCERAGFRTLTLNTIWARA